MRKPILCEEDSIMKIDERKLNEFVEKAVTDLAAGYGGVMTVLGHKLGLYKAMAHAGPLDSSEVAERSAVRSATCANGSTVRRQPVTSFIIPPARPTSSPRNRRSYWRRMTARYSCRPHGRCPFPCFLTRENDERPSHWHRRRLGRAQ